jgi:hypothetical protein
MSDTPRVSALLSSAISFDDIICLAKTLERELAATNKVIADAIAYVEEFRDFFPEEDLLRILERKVPDEKTQAQDTPV